MLIIFTIGSQKPTVYNYTCKNSELDEAATIETYEQNRFSNFNVSTEYIHVWSFFPWDTDLSCEM